MLPGIFEYFNDFDGKSIRDVDLTILDIQTKEIEPQRLNIYHGIWYGKPATRLSDGYIPENPIYEIEQRYTPTIRLWTFASYFGQYDRDTWALRAVTHLKYHVSNASYIPRFTWASGVDEFHNDADDSVAEYYTLQGLKVSNPEPGQLYIMRRGCKTRKIFYR